METFTLKKPEHPPLNKGVGYLDFIIIELNGATYNNQFVDYFVGECDGKTYNWITATYSDLNKFLTTPDDGLDFLEK
jgi:hypothetical protein